jgi:thioesterase domain-containing protein
MRGASAVAGLRHAVLTMAVAAGFVLAEPAGFAIANPATATPRRAVSSAQVVLIKGLAGLFSSGMIDLGEKLRRRGIPVRIESHADSEALLDDIARHYKASRGPIVILGHSLGADVAGGLARRLNEQHIPVALLVTFGPLSDPIVTPNVARAVNYYQSASAWRGQMVPAPGFRGSLSNVNLDGALDINHFNIEKADRLHAETIAKVSAALGRPQAR